MNLRQLIRDLTLPAAVPPRDAPVFAEKRCRCIACGRLVVIVPDGRLPDVFFCFPCVVAWYQSQKLLDKGRSKGLPSAR